MGVAEISNPARSISHGIGVAPRLAAWNILWSGPGGVACGARTKNLGVIARLFYYGPKK